MPFIDIYVFNCHIHIICQQLTYYCKQVIEHLCFLLYIFLPKLHFALVKPSGARRPMPRRWITWGLRRLGCSGTTHGGSSNRRWRWKIIKTWHTVHLVFINIPVFFNVLHSLFICFVITCQGRASINWQIRACHSTSNSAYWRLLISRIA